MAETPINNAQAEKPKPKLSTLKSLSEKKPIPSAPKVELPRQQPVSTYVKPSVLPQAELVKDQILTNTINAVGKNAGIGDIKKSSPIYESVKQSILNSRDNGGLVATKDQEGNPVYLSSSSIGKQLADGWSSHYIWLKKGENYNSNDTKSNIRILESNLTKTPRLEITPKEDGFFKIIGEMAMPTLQSIPGQVAAFATKSAAVGAGVTAALAGPDASYIKYAKSLEENYAAARKQGMGPEMAYASANKSAKFASGIEYLNQAIFGSIATPTEKGGEVAKQVASEAKKLIFKESKVKALARTTAQFLKTTGNTVKVPAYLATEIGLGKGIEDVQTEKEGIQVDDKLTRALESGSPLIMMHYGIMGLSGLMKLPGYLKSSFANSFIDADKEAINNFAKEGERSGVYPKGTANKVRSTVSEFAKAKEQSPSYEGDDVREQVVSGLTLKLNKLIDEQSKLADIHKPDLDARINDIKERIAKAKTIDDPLSVEISDDGTPLVSQQDKSIEQTKTQQDATTTSKQQVQESVPASSVGEYQRAESVEAQAANEADNRNSLIGGKEPQEKLTPTQKAEQGMEGIKTDDAAELMRIARRAYDKEEAKDFPGIAAIMRKEMESKLDMSNISNETLIKLAEEAASKSEKYQFKAGPAKRVELPAVTSYAKEEILTNPREVFKAMYAKAQETGESMANRLKMAADAIAEARKGKGLFIDVKNVQKSLSKYVTSKMTTEDAADAFADNLDDIIRDAENAKTNTANKGLIQDIRKAARSKSFGTVGTKETTQGIDFISPSKVENPSEYNQLLSDYKKSITGEIPESANARQLLKDYVVAERQKYEAIRISKLQSKYDALVAKGEPPMTSGENPRILTKDEYVSVMTDPTSAKTPELTAYEYKVSESKADVMKEMTDVRQGMLKEAIDNGDIDESIIPDAKQIAGIDVNKLQPKNIKLFNNIIEDVMNGEQPSRMGEIISDVERFDKVSSLGDDFARIRNIVRAKTIGAFNKLITIFGYKGSEKKYDLMSLTNIIRNMTFNDKDTSELHNLILGDFDEQHRKVVEISKNFQKSIHDIFNAGSVIIGGKKYKFDSPFLKEINSYRMGIASALAQLSDVNINLQTIGNSVMKLSKISEDNFGEKEEVVKHIVDALKEFDLIESITFSPSGRQITSLRFKENINIDNILSKLNDRELMGIVYTRQMFKSLAPDLDKSLRSNFGESLDMSNENYLPLTAFFTGDNQVIDLEGDIYDGIPEQMRSMRAGTTMDRNRNLVGESTRDGKPVDVHYDFNFFSTMRSRYHESLNTAYTAKEVKTLNKLINDSKFQDYISGKAGLEPKDYTDNVKILNSKIKNYVNMQRSPYMLSDAQQAQRSRLSKFIYGQLLNSYKQVFKQSLPSISYTISEAGVMPFYKANEMVYGFLANKDYNTILKGFLKQTSMSDRDLGGFEAYADMLANLDDNKLTRAYKNIFDGAFKITSKPLSWGDKYASITSLLVGYMKGLKQFGVISDYSEIDLPILLTQPLDKRALAYAENFQSIVNNSSNSASRAKVLREKNSSVLRLLQSYNLNQWVNFNIDFGRLSDPMATSSDKVQAGKRVLQYLGMQGLFGSAAWGLAEVDKMGIDWLMQQSGSLDLNPVDEDKQSQKYVADAVRYGVGTGMDMVTGGMNVIGQQGVKWGLDAAFLFYQNQQKEEALKQGKIINGTWLANDFNPIYRSNFLGLNGTFLEKADRVLKMVQKKEDLAPPLTEANQNFKTVTDWSTGIALFTPLKDAQEITNNAKRILKERGMTQMELDVYHYSRRNDPHLSELERQESKDYIQERSKSSENWESYFVNKAYPEYVKSVKRDTFLKETARMFGKEKGKEMYKIMDMSGPKLYTVLNNRYEGVDAIKNRELMFMIQYGGITPEEYAMAVAFDKDGKPRLDMTDAELSQQFKERYTIAEAIYPANLQGKFPKQRYTSDPSILVNELNKQKAAMMIQRDKNR